MANAAISAALDVARARHTAVAAGDYEAYEALEGPIAEACAALANAGPGVLVAGDIPALDELIALETQSRRLLELLMAEATASMDSLRRTRRAAGAYWSQERLSVNGV